jgi:flagellar hook-associated protein 1 FlgK
LEQSDLGTIGNGVRAVEIERIYDRFIGVQINYENQSLGRWEAQKQIMEGVEGIFDESDGYGLSQAMNDFWNAWQDLSNNPDGDTERLVLESKGEILAAAFNQKHADLKSAQKGIDANINASVEKINQLAEQVADLNQKITETEASGGPANEFRDQRDLALKELSGLIDVSTFENGNGAVKVLLNGGRTLVDETSYRSLSTQSNSSGLADILWVAGDGSTVDITGDISGGKLKGWLETRDVVIADYLDQLNDLAATLSSEVNSLHAAGFGRFGSTGDDFFSGTDAADIQVNSDIINDVNLIAAASEPAGVPGDNSNAIAIANLQNKLTMSANSATFDDYYHSLVSDVGNQVQKATSYFEHQTQTATYLDNYRESISGVSLDEEMVNLIKFQSAYDASAKLISTTDEMIQTLLDMI